MNKQYKRILIRDAIAAYRHAERYHMDSASMDVWDDGYRMQELANHLARLLYRREIRPRPKPKA